MNSFAVDLISIPSVEDLFWYVAQNVVGRLKFVDCVIYQANEAQTELVQVAALGEKNPFGRSIINPLKIPFGHGITGQVAQSRAAIVVDDLLTDQNYIEDTQAARSEICVPLICGNRVYGVIDSEHPDVAAFGDAEMEVLTTIAAMTSAKLELLAEADQSKQRYHDLVAAHAQLSQETTNRKALEAELFNARKLEAVGRLTGRFAHEFNNFLTVIAGNLEFLEEDIGDGPLAETLAAPLNDAQAAAKRGAQLIQSMLAFSKRTQLRPEVADLNALVSAVFAQGLVTDDIVLKLNLAANPCAVNVDVSVLKTVLLNLVKNAKEAAPESGEIHISTESVTLSFNDKQPLVTPLTPGRYICLSVEDDGIGISQDELQQIFDPFFTTKPVGAGTGLGLSMTLGFMQQSGGSVAVHSQTGQGSVFQLYFPEASDDGSDLLTIHR